MNIQASISSIQGNDVAEDVSKHIQLLTMSQTVNLIGSWEWDLQTDKLLWTDAMFLIRAIPVSADNLISIEDNYKYVHEADREMVREKFESLRTKGNTEFEYRIVVPSGQTRIISAWAALFKDSNGEPRFIRGTSQDVTKLRKIEQQLNELNQVYEYAEEMAKIGNWQWKSKKNQFIFSKNLYRILGCEPDEFEPSYEEFKRFVHPQDSDKVSMAYENLQQNLVATCLEFRIFRKGGELRTVKSIGKVITNEKSEIVIFGTLQDITDEVSLLRELEEKRSFAEMLIENSVDLIKAYDADKRLIAWNKKCEERYHLSNEDVLGKHVLEIYPHIKGSKKMDELDRALQGEFIHQTEQVPGIQKQFYEYFIIPLRNSADEVFGALSITHDLTEIKTSADMLRQLNQSLEQKNKELESSNDELASFSYVASHDLQEPLRKIQTFSRLIREKDGPALSYKGNDYFKRIEAASQRMQVLIDDLLTFSRTTNYPKKFLNTNLNRILDEAKQELKDSIEEKKAVIDSVELPVVNIIPFQFRQLMVNLISNSIKYSKPEVAPHINITYKLVDARDIQSFRAKSEAYYQFFVSDNGIGFEQQYAKKIFELFQRLHGRSEYPGTGLGLAICKKIAENHNGFIEAKSVLNEGSTFIIYLPVEQS